MTQLTSIRTAKVLTLNSHGYSKTQGLINQINTDLRSDPATREIFLASGFVWPFVHVPGQQPRAWKGPRITIIIPEKGGKTHE